MLLRRIAANQEERPPRAHIAQGSRRVGLARHRRCESREVRRAMVVDVVGPKHRACELLQQVVLFVAGTVGTNNSTDSGACRSRFLESTGDQLERLVPRRRNKLPVTFNQRARDALFMVGKIEGVASLDAQEVAVDSTLVAIVAAHDLHPGVRAAHSQGGLAAVTAMRADGAKVLHLPRPCLVAVSAGGERADRADVDAHAALFALQMLLLVRCNDGARTTV